MEIKTNFYEEIMNFFIKNGISNGSSFVYNSFLNHANLLFDKNICEDEQFTQLYCRKFNCLFFVENENTIVIRPIQKNHYNQNRKEKICIPLNQIIKIENKKVNEFNELNIILDKNSPLHIIRIFKK